MHSDQNRLLLLPASSCPPRYCVYGRQRLLQQKLPFPKLDEKKKGGGGETFEMEEVQKLSDGRGKSFVFGDKRFVKGSLFGAEDVRGALSSPPNIDIEQVQKTSKTLTFMGFSRLPTTARICPFGHAHSFPEKKQRRLRKYHVPRRGL